MRLPSLEQDRWQLRSGEESHRRYLDSFPIPPLKKRQGLKRGQAAQLIFDIAAQDATGNTVVGGERMWVIVAERLGDFYVGILDNKPASFEPGDDVYLCFGAEVPFRAEHVIATADPPKQYADWQLGQPPERRWPRD
jgi:hypothetical protein